MFVDTGIDVARAVFDFSSILFRYWIDLFIHQYHEKDGVDWCWAHVERKRNKNVTISRKYWREEGYIIITVAPVVRRRGEKKIGDRGNVVFVSENLN